MIRAQGATIEALKGQRGSVPEALERMRAELARAAREHALLEQETAEAWAMVHLAETRVKEARLALAQAGRRIA